METPEEALPGKIPGSAPPRFSIPLTSQPLLSVPSTARSMPASAPPAISSSPYGDAPPIIFAASDESTQAVVGEEDVAQKAAEMGPTDAQLQAHIMAYMKDRHGIEFDPKLNPDIPKPCYLGTKVVFSTGQEAYQYSPRLRREDDIVDTVRDLGKARKFVSGRGKWMALWELRGRSQCVLVTSEYRILSEA